MMLALEIPMRWPGHSCGIRAPVFGETPLSPDEVTFAVRKGLLAVLVNKKLTQPAPKKVLNWPEVEDTEAPRPAA